MGSERFNQALLNCSMDSWFYDGAVAKLVNKGTLGGTVQLGDGVTPATFPTQVFPHGMSFDGASDYLQVPAPASGYSFGNGVTDSPFSVELLVKGSLFAAFKGSWGTTEEWGFYTSGGAVYLQCFTSSAIYFMRGTSSAVAFPGVINHYVGTYDGSRVAAGINVYAGGTQRPVSTFSAGVYTAMSAQGGPLGINIIPALQYYAGTIYDIAVYPFVLQPGEIASLYRARLGLLQRGA